jgi:hypothetical protein
MGGFFGKGKDKGKDKKDEKPAPPAAAPANRPSRRAVVPGGAPSTQRVGPPGSKPATQRVSPPGPSAPGQTGSVFAKPKPKSADSDQLVLSPGEMPQRPDSRSPIVSSGAPNFSGNISTGARPAGPCRTGDAALLDFMVTKAKLISADQAQQVTSKANGEGIGIDAAAVALGLVTEDQLVSALTQECWVPHLKVDKYEIRKKALDTVSREDAVHFSVFPVDKLGSLLTLAMVNPLDQETIRVLESKTNLDVKRVVATRTEIQQGIEKYYSGLVEAKDTSISFVADAAQEEKSVTQLLGNVKASDAGPGSTTIKTAGELDIAPEIQDIDDLLSADEVIAPAIIEPKLAEVEAPLVVPVGEIIEISEPQIMDSPALEARSAPEIKPATTTRIAAPEFELDETDAIAPAIKPATEIRRAPEVQPASAAVARSVTGSFRPSTGNQGRSEAGQGSKAPGSSTNLFPARTGTGRVANPKVVNLIPVLEEEFQHAITHGKAHVFEKWVGLQSRNRIINAVPVESEFDDLLAGVFADGN